VVLVGEDASFYFIKNTWTEVVTPVAKRRFQQSIELEGEPFVLQGFDVWMTYRRPPEGSWNAPQFFVNGAIGVVDRFWSEWVDTHKKYLLPRGCGTRKIR